MFSEFSLFLQTERLFLIPYSPEIIEMISGDKMALSKRWGWEVPGDWPWSEVVDALPFFAQLASDPTQLGWGAWLIIEAEHHRIIGDAGFGGKPDADGRVEMGYNIVKADRQQGYGFEAVQALVNWAKSQPKLKKIVATCPVENIASIRIVEKLGMECVQTTEELSTWELSIH